MKQNIIIFIALAGILFVFGCTVREAPSAQELIKIRTIPENLYFSYTDDEINSLRALDSEFEISVVDLYFEDNKLNSFRPQSRRSGFEVDGAISKAFTTSKGGYVELLLAQREAVLLSKLVHGTPIKGSIEPVSKEAICIFDKKICEQWLVRKTDPYSELLASIVASKIKERKAEADKTLRLFVAKEGDQYYKGTTGDPFTEEEISTQTWIIGEVKNFRPKDAPPVYGSPEYEKQVQEVYNRFQSLRDEERRQLEDLNLIEHATTLFVDQVTEELNRNNANIEQHVMMRSLIQMVVMDARRAAQDSQYYYQQQRPFEALKAKYPDNPAVQAMGEDSSPSYLSQTMAGLFGAAPIAGYFSPQQADRLMAYAKRITSYEVAKGEHFPIDIESSSKLGQQIADAIIKNKWFAATNADNIARLGGAWGATTDEDGNVIEEI